jgi:hypothetical protein
VITYEDIEEQVTHLLRRGTVASEVAVQLGLDYDVPTDAVVLPGWWADDGNWAVFYPHATSGREAAEEYVGAGDWGSVESSCGLLVYVWRAGLCADPETGEVAEVQVQADELPMEVDPEEPGCSSEEHEWSADHDVVGGCEENPGVFSSGFGSVSATEACRNCGLLRTTDYGATCPETGRQITQISYERGIVALTHACGRSV